MRSLALTVCLLFGSPPAEPTPAPTPTPAPEVDLVAKHRSRLGMKASSTWKGWPEGNAIDGRFDTSWFSGKNDSAALKGAPWLEIHFPEDVAVRRVDVFGNRDPDWATGYTIHLARLELFDAAGRPLSTGTNEGYNHLQDMQFKLKSPVADVRRLRITSLADEGDKNRFGDIAIAELRVY